MTYRHLVEAEELLQGHDAVVFDCRFALADAAAGRARYDEGHIPGAHFIDLNSDLSAPAGQHGGRHPLPAPAAFAATLADFGVDRQTDVIAYDDAGFGFVGRLWWMMRSLGYRPPRLLNGGYQAFVAAGGQPQLEVPQAQPCPVPEPGEWQGVCDIHGVRAAQTSGALLVDSRDAARYQGLEEPIDPVAGHIPGAINRPWAQLQEADGKIAPVSQLESHWEEVLQAEQVVVYCGSGVSACANLFSLALLGRDDAVLYAGSWSDWCSHL